MKSATKRNSDFYNSSKPFLKIQRILKSQSMNKTLSEIKSMSRSDLENLKIDSVLLDSIFNKSNSLNAQIDLKVQSENVIDTPEIKIDDSTKESLENTKESEIQIQNQNSNVQTQTDQTVNDQITKSINEFSGIDVVYPNWKNKMQEVSIPYMERNNEIDFIIRHSTNTDKITNLCGESGIGKTLLAKTISKVLKSAFIFVGCHDNLTSDDLEGSIQLMPNDKKEIQTKYVLGGIAQAIHCANTSDSKTSVICFDEINTLLPQVQKILNNRTNFKEGIEINSIGLKLKLNEGCKIIALATQNPAHYNGTYPLNSELLSKIKCVYMKDLTDSELITLIKSNFKDLISSDLIEQIIQFKNTMSNAHKNGTLDRGIDTREVMSFCQDYKIDIDSNCDHDTALRSACHLNFFGKYSTTGIEDQIKFCNETIESCFGISDTKLI